MIKVRLNALSEGIEISRKDKENLKQLVERVLLENGHNSVSEELLQHITVLINAVEVDRELWSSVYYENSDEVLVASVIRGGSFGQIFKQVVIIAATITAAVFFPPSVVGSFASAAIVTATSIGTSLLMNSLIPPPSVGGGNIGGVDYSSLAASQMYSITAQSNRVNKYGGVPRVYGKHRVFPVVASNPYTEIEVDQSTGELVQFFYGIFDFGYGPLMLSDFKLGDTSISNYADIEYRLVDLNKPTISEGPWDDVLQNDFTIYKGDIETDNTSVGINGNETSGGDLSEYQIIRNASPVVEGNSQEIILNFVCPQGLIAYGTNGNSYPVNIDLEVHFSKVGEDNWRSFNDYIYVDEYRYAGGSDTFNYSECTLPSLVPTYFTLLSQIDDVVYYVDLEGSIASAEVYNKAYGYKKGDTSFIFSNASATIGDTLTLGNSFIGTIISKVAHPSLSGFSIYTISSPITSDVVMFNSNYRKDNNALMSTTRSSNVINKRLVVLSKARITRKETGQVYSTISFKPKEIGQYKIRVKRVRTFSDANYQVLSDLSLYSLVTRFNRNPITTPNRHVFMEIRIRATNQLNGTIQNLSAISHSVLDVYDNNTSTWSKQVTSNPAWVFCDLLTGAINKRAISKSRLHMPSIVEWSELCDTVPTPPPTKTYTFPRFSTNFILDFDTTLQQALNLVANGAQASLNIVDGKYGVLIDKLKTTPVQIFTPRNSWGFSSSRTYTEKPHAVKIGYIDPEAEWEAREVVVYDNGYNEANATLFDTLDSFACTNPEQAWRFGRYMLAQNRLRQETISINVDFEHLVCTRGDYVKIVQDSMKVGGRAARVKSIAGNRIEIDERLEILPLTDYGYVFRNATSGIHKSTLEVVNEYTFDLDGNLPAVGDLIVIGQVDYETIDCIVKSITPQSDLMAQLTLIEKADAIYEAESTGDLPNYTPQISPTENTEFAPPGEVQNLEVSANTYKCLGSGYQYYIELDWDVPSGSVYSSFEVYADFGRGYKLVDVINDTVYQYVVNEVYLGVEHKFKILALSASGKKLDIGSVGFVSATPVSKTTPPSDIEALYINITDQILQLDWKAITDCDVSEYLIRYSPTLNGTWESSIPLGRVDRNTNSAQFNARTGTYLIKAVDFNDNESSTAALAITSIPELTGLNIITETNDFPTLAGELYQTKKEGDSLILQKKNDGSPTANEYYSDGYYYYSDLLDLGEIYTVRLQSLIEAEGFTVDDIMSNWASLSDVILLANSRQSEWDVETQYRATDNFNVISEWGALSDVVTMNNGQDDNWTPWRKFIMGDFSGRIFQFRLKLISNKPSVTPRVFNGIIKADMNDRVESYNNITVPSTGLHITYSPSFKGPGTSPNIQVTQDDATQGDYYKITNKGLDGFDITFYDSTDTPVERTADIFIKGYGRKTTLVL